MKFFRKKNSNPVQSSGKTGGVASDQHFYSRHADEAPLDDYFDETKISSVRRTSRHSLARRHENNNRASDWALAVLLLRTALVILLLVGGFFVLKLVLERMSEPSEKEKLQWEEKASRMERPGSSVEFSGDPVARELTVGVALIEQRLASWDQAGRLFRSAEALTLRGINEEAAQRLEQAVRVAPDNRAVLHLLADVYMNLGRADKAVPLYVRLLDQEGLQPALQMDLLRALQESGQTEAGLVLADRVLLDQPSNEFVLSLAAEGQLQKGNADAALTMYQRILETSPTNTVALKQCGEIYAGRGDYKQAVPYYLDLVRLDPSPNHYRALAQLYARQNQAGQTVVFMVQAASLFTSATVAPWLKNPEFDSVRETVEFRSFADRMIGEEARKAGEAINRREAEKAALGPVEMDLPKQPELQLKPNQ